MKEEFIMQRALPIFLRDPRPGVGHADIDPARIGGLEADAELAPIGPHDELAQDAR